MVCSSPVLRAQGQPSSSQDEPSACEPDLLWLTHLTGAHIGLAPISQDPEDRCTIWENLVSLVDFQCPGFPLTAEELCHYIDIPRTAGRSSVTATPPPAVAWPPQLPADIDYKTNAHAKPPYSYATLICMAMEASKEPKLTLAAICKWISDNFCYYRRADPAWQSSIRHNLCINRRFVKVPRRKGEPGRGAFWKLHPQYAKWLKSSPFKGRRTPPEPVLPACAQQGAQRVLSPAPAGGSQGSLEVSAELQRLLREFEEFESSHNLDPAGSQEGQQLPTPPAEASWLPSCASGSREEQDELPELSELTELTELKGTTDWEALLNNLPEQGDFSSLEDLQLPSPSQPGMSPLHLQGQQQMLLEPGLDETLMATAFLEAAWREETSESLSSGIPGEQGAENIQASLPDGDVVDWGSLTDLNL